MPSLIIEVRQIAPFRHHPLRLTVEEGAELLHVESSGRGSLGGPFRNNLNPKIGIFGKVASRISTPTSRIFSHLKLSSRFDGRRFWQRLPSHVVGG